ncbi:MAG: hemolysin III family protein [Treponema sp.]|jgi:hemolysin III|nr:hemolysin III family protein [Treponema sp.]
MSYLEKSRKIPDPLPFQTPGEEIANAVLHGIGAGLAIAGMALLIRRAGESGNPGAAVNIRVISAAIYTSAMIAMFLTSTLYHAFQHDGTKRVFRVLDHGAIYLLIAGTYTPYSLICLGGTLGWVYTGLEWGLAAAGISLYAAGFKFIKKIELAIYIIMGWSIAAVFTRLLRSTSPAALVLLAAGGLSYTLGTIWYSRRRRLSHVIWHVFVLAGALLHWFSVWLILAPSS